MRDLAQGRSRIAAWGFSPVRLVVLPASRCFLALLLVLGIITGLPAQSAEEYELKAAFVIKILNFVQWPADSNSNLVIGVIGADKVAGALTQLAAGKSVNGKRIVVTQLRSDSDFKSCQVVFIGAGERKNLPSLLQRMPGVRVLTIGESDGFGQRGGMINLPVSEGRIHLEVNKEAIDRAQLQISSRLLSLATMVKGDG